MGSKHTCPECNLIFEAELPQTGVMLCPLCDSAFTALRAPALAPMSSTLPPATSGRQVLRGVMAVGAVLFLAGGLGYAYYLMGDIGHKSAAVTEPEAPPPPPTVSPKPVEIFPTFRLAKPQPRTLAPQADPPSRPSGPRPAVIPTLPQLVQTPPAKPAEPRLQSLAPESEPPRLPAVAIPTLSQPVETSPIKLAEPEKRRFVPRSEPSFQPPKPQLVVLPKERRPLTQTEHINRAIDHGVAYLRARVFEHKQYRNYLALFSLTLLKCGIAAYDPSVRQTAAPPSRPSRDESGPTILQGRDAFLGQTGQPFDPSAPPGPIILQGPDAYLGQIGKSQGPDAQAGPIILQGPDAYARQSSKPRNPSAPPGTSITRAPSTK